MSVNGSFFRHLPDYAACSPVAKNLPASSMSRARNVPSLDDFSSHAKEIVIAAGWVARYFQCKISRGDQSVSYGVAAKRSHGHRTAKQTCLISKGAPARARQARPLPRKFEHPSSKNQSYQQWHALRCLVDGPSNFGFREKT